MKTVTIYTDGETCFAAFEEVNFVRLAACAATAGREKQVPSDAGGIWD